jgi:hypothetical protein
MVGRVVSGVADGAGVFDGPADGEGLADGREVAVALGVALGIGEEVADGPGDAVGEAVGLADAGLEGRPSVPPGEIGSQPLRTSTRTSGRRRITL